MDDEKSNEIPLTKPTLITEFDSKRRELAFVYTRTSRRYSIRLMIISFIISVCVLISRITVIFRDIVNKLSLENEQFKKMARDIRVSQMGTPGEQVMTNLTRRLNTIEKKITEVEQGMSKPVKDTNPIILE